VAVTANMRQVGTGNWGGPQGPSVSGAPVRLGSTAGNPNDFKARAFIDSPRYRELDRRQAYFECTQHDYKRFDFDGRIISAGPGIAVTQPLISAEKYPNYVPLRNRRPSAPYRLCRAMVKAFTSMVFGENRFPMTRVAGDTDTQDFIQTLVRVGKMGSRLMQARNLGGATGTAVWSWAYVNGRPRFEVHNAKQVYVHEWEDRSQFIPRYVTECYQFHRDIWNAQRERMERVPHWYRRDWTPDEDLIYVEVPVVAGKEPASWVVDDKRSIRHDDGVCHFTWVQNIPDEDDDGQADCEGLWENFDALDTTLSVVVRGATLNLDPTLVIKGDRDFIQRFGVKKGSDNALIADKDGDAKYLELQGAGMEVGLKIVNEMRRSILEVGECVLADPDKLAAQGTSSVAQKMIFKPMLGKADGLREQYGDGIVRTLDAMMQVAHALDGKMVDVPDDLDGSSSGDDAGESQELPKTKKAQMGFNLPKRVEKEPVLDEDGRPTGEETVTLIERTPGEGGDIDLQWPDYFPPTPTDQQMIVTTLSTAVAQAPIMSQQTATEIVMGAFGKEGADEWTRVQQAQAQVEDKQAQMFEDAGGKQAPGAGKGGKPPEPGGDDAGSDAGSDAPSGGAPGAPGGGKGGGEMQHTVTHEQEFPGGGKITHTAAPKPPPPVIAPPGAKGGKGSGSPFDDESDDAGSSKEK